MYTIILEMYTGIKNLHQKLLEWFLQELFTLSQIAYYEDMHIERFFILIVANVPMCDSSNSYTERI